MSAYTFYSYIMSYLAQIMEYRLVIGNSAYTFIGLINTTLMITLALYVLRKLVR